MARTFFIFRAKKKKFQRNRVYLYPGLRDGGWELKSVCGVGMVFFSAKGYLFEVSSLLHRVDLLHKVDKCPMPSILWWG